MKKTDYRLPYDFSDRVMDQINREIIIRERRKEALVMATFLSASLLAVIAILFILIYLNIISMPSVTLPSISLSPIFDAIKSHYLYLIVGINIVILYILGERLAIRRSLREVSHLPS